MPKGMSQGLQHNAIASEARAGGNQREVIALETSREAADVGPQCLELRLVVTNKGPSTTSKDTPAESLPYGREPICNFPVNGEGEAGRRNSG